MNHKTDMQDDDMAPNQRRALSKGLAAIEAALADQPAGAPVAWQIRRVHGRIDGVLTHWENCTKELYETTLATGRYAGYENGPRCEVRALFAASAPTLGETNTDNIAVDTFAQAMKEKMADAHAKGRSGWECMSPSDLSRMLREHVEKGDPRDVANFCMMLWHHSAQIAPQSQAAEPKGLPGGVTVPRVLLQDLTDDVEDYSVSREFKPSETAWRADLLARARSLLTKGE